MSEETPALEMVAVCTVCAIAPEAALKLPSPEYCTAIEWLPNASRLVPHAAEPPASESGEQPAIATPLSVNVTLPVGAPPVLAMDAVNVTGWLALEGFAELVTETVGVAFTRQLPVTEPAPPTLNVA